MYAIFEGKVSPSSQQWIKEIKKNIFFLYFKMYGTFCSKCVQKKISWSRVERIKMCLIDVKKNTKI